MSDVTLSLVSNPVSINLGNFDTVSGASALTTANRLVKVASTGGVTMATIAESGITGVLTITKTGTTARTITFPDAADTVAVLGTAQTFSALKTFTAGITASGAAIDHTHSTGITTRAAATQDAIALVGRAGGTSSYVGTLTPTALTASRTYTMPDASIVVAGSASALTSGRVPFVTTGGLLTDSAELAFATRTLTIGAGDTGSSFLVLRGTTGSAKAFNFQTGAAARWQVKSHTDAESGSDAGSTFRIEAYADAGTFIDTPFSIVRASGGAITLARPVTSTGVITVPNGTAASTGWRLTSEAHGAYRVSSTSMGFAVAGTAAASLTSAGLLSATSLALAGTLAITNTAAGTNSVLLTQTVTSAISGQVNQIAPTLTYSGDSATRTIAFGVDFRTASGSTFNLTNASAGDNRVLSAGFVHQGTGTITDMTGLGFNLSNSSTGTITNWHGIYVTASAIGTTTNYTGIEIGAVGGGTGIRYGLRVGNMSGGSDNRAIITGTGLVTFGDTTDATAIGTAGFISAAGASIAKSLWVGGTAGNYVNIANSTGELRVNNTKVVTARQTGWGAATGTATRTTYDTTTVTTEQLAQRVKGLIDDLITHGLIGT